MSWVVRVTYGNTQPLAVFARGIGKREDAEKLKERAISQGFTDAEVLSAEAFKEMCAASTRGQAYSGRPSRQRR
jgi:hypothetical protein